MPFYLAAASSFITFLLVLFVLKESLSKEKRGQHADKKSSIWSSFSGSLSILYILQWFISLSLSGLEASFAYFAAKKAGLDAIDLGYIFMIMGFGSALVQGGLVGRFSKKYGEGTVIQGGIIVSTIGFVLILLVNSFYNCSNLFNYFWIRKWCHSTCVSALLTKKSTAGHGSATGLLSSFDSFGRIIGPPLGGWLFSITAGLPYISGAILSILALMLYQVYRIKKNSTGLYLIE